MCKTAMRKAGRDNLALTVLYVPSSLDSGEAHNLEEEGGRLPIRRRDHRILEGRDHRVLGIVLL